MFQVTHHSSPQFHAYFHMSSSFPGILAGVLTEGLGLNGLTWVRHNIIELLIYLFNVMSL